MRLAHNKLFNVVIKSKYNGFNLKIKNLDFCLN
jgi:hypothetical protein